MKITEIKIKTKPALIGVGNSLCLLYSTFVIHDLFFSILFFLLSVGWLYLALEYRSYKKEEDSSASN